MSFGVKFGELVKRRRAIEDISQEELAARAFGDPAKKTRISELENGKVANPRPSTVDALCTALNIDGEAIENFTKTKERPPEHENICDFFHLDGLRSMDFEVAVNEKKMAALYHDRALKVELLRVEYISDQRTLVLVDVDGRRRNHWELPENISSRLESCERFFMFQCLVSKDNIVSEIEVPYKILR